MTDLLKEALREQAQTQAPPRFDVDQIMRDGEARAGRGRMTTGLVAAGVAGVLALGGVGIAQLGDSPADLRVADQRDARPAFAERRVTYAQGPVIHYGVERIDVGQKITSFVQTDDGFVFTTDDGSVHLADGRTVSDIGSTDAEAGYLSSDDSGSLAAWVEFAAGESPSLVVYDTAERGEVLRSSDVTTPGMVAFRDGDAALVYAVDDGTVYWRTAEGMVAVDVETGTSELVLPDAGGFDVLDVAAGEVAHMTDDGSERLHVSADPTEPGPRMPWGWDGDLSPDARLVAVDQADKAAIFDTSTGQNVTPRASGYAFRSFYAWLDESRVAMLAIEDAEAGRGMVDLLECSVVDGTCTLAQDDVVELSDDDAGVDLALPVGERIS
jgi:hypothetical protein